MSAPPPPKRRCASPPPPQCLAPFFDPRTFPSELWGLIAEWDPAVPLLLRRVCRHLRNLVDAGGVDIILPAVFDDGLVVDDELVAFPYAAATSIQWTHARELQPCPMAVEVMQRIFARIAGRRECLTRIMFLGAAMAMDIGEFSRLSVVEGLLVPANKVARQQFPRRLSTLSMRIEGAPSPGACKAMWGRLNGCALAELHIDNGTTGHSAVGDSVEETVEEMLTGLCGLGKLEIPFWRVNMLPALVLDGGARWARLTVLDVSNNELFGDAALGALVIACTGLEDLVAHSSGITDGGVRAFAPLEELRTVCFGGGSLEQSRLLEALTDCAKSLPKLEGCSLFYAEVTHEELDPAAWRAFCAGVGPRLVNLRLNNVWVDDDMLIDLKLCTRLVKLALIGGDWWDFLEPDGLEESVLPEVICAMPSLLAVTARVDPYPDDFNTEVAEDEFRARVSRTAEELDIKHALPSLCLWPADEY